MASTPDLDEIDPDIVFPVRGGMLAAVSDGGTVRWVRCTSALIEVRASASAADRPTTALVHFMQADGKTPGEWRTVSLADGVIGDVVDSPAPLDDGTAGWSDPTAQRPPLEGSFARGGDGLVVASVCAGEMTGGDPPCAAQLRGYDAAYHTVLWERPGLFNVSVVAGGYALVRQFVQGGNDDEPWVMIDARTGEPVPGQEWPGGRQFTIGCCGDIGYYDVLVDGGVALVLAGTHIDIWYPADAGVAPHTIVLP